MFFPLLAKLMFMNTWFLRNGLIKNIIYVLETKNYSQVSRLVFEVGSGEFVLFEDVS